MFRPCIFFAVLASVALAPKAEHTVSLVQEWWGANCSAFQRVGGTSGEAQLQLILDSVLLTYDSVRPTNITVERSACIPGARGVTSTFLLAGLPPGDVVSLREAENDIRHAIEALLQSGPYLTLASILSVKNAIFGGTYSLRMFTSVHGCNFPHATGTSLGGAPPSCIATMCESGYTPTRDASSCVALVNTESSAVQARVLVPIICLGVSLLVLGIAVVVFFTSQDKKQQNKKTEQERAKNAPDVSASSPKSPAGRSDPEQACTVETPVVSPTNGTGPLSPSSRSETYWCKTPVAVSPLKNLPRFTSSSPPAVPYTKHAVSPRTPHVSASPEFLSQANPPAEPSPVDATHPYLYKDVVC